MNFKHLNTFITLSHCKSFSVAATRLHTVQSAISRHINQLETELGVTLVNRNTRNVSLTEAGETFLKHTQAIISHYEQAKSEVQLIDQGKKGLLRIGYMSSACAHFLPEILKNFAESEPLIDIEIHDMTAAQQLESLSEGRLDIGFSRPIDGKNKRLIKHRHLYNDPILLVVSQTHPLASRNSVSLSYIADFPLILFTRTHAPSLFDTLINAFYQEGIRPKLLSEPTSMQALLTQVASSQSVGLVPGCVRNLQTQYCRFIPVTPSLQVALEMHWPVNPSTTAQTWLDWFKKRSNSGAISRFFNEGIR
jgi:DNA-binding transcriptional LysR family regulator